MSDELIYDWKFEPSAPSKRTKARRLAAFSKRRRTPSYREIYPVTPKPLWAVYFIYSPTGTLSPSHKFTLDSLINEGLKIFVVFSSKRPDLIDQRIHEYADALCWKDVSGYDFSGYSIALRTLARKSSGCTALFLNDSVFGPFSRLLPFIEHSSSSLSGFTASSAFENHIQSYAFILRNVSPESFHGLGKIFPRSYAYNDPISVVLCQETQFARFASQTLDVDATWYSSSAKDSDPCVMHYQFLLNNGFPFIKKSLLSKYASRGNQDELLGDLHSFGHPLPEL